MLIYASCRLHMVGALSRGHPVRLRRCHLHAAQSLGEQRIHVTITTVRPAGAVNNGFEHTRRSTWSTHFAHTTLCDSELPASHSCAMTSASAGVDRRKPRARRGPCRVRVQFETFDNMPNPGPPILYIYVCIYIYFAACTKARCKTPM